MIQRMVSAWKQSKRLKRYRQFRNGYAWAAGELLSGMSLSYVELKIDNPFEPEDEFDRGAKAAIIDFESKIKDEYLKKAERIK